MSETPLTEHDENPEKPQSKLAEIRDEFLALDVNDRLLLLLEFANDLPPLPEQYASHPELFERVLECQAPVTIFVDVDKTEHVHLYATAPAEAPTTRGFASILVQGIDGLLIDEALAISDDYPHTLGITKAVSLLRLSGMTGLLARTKRQIREKINP